ncbi:MAG TPA: GNAT family protein [Terriglobia bacterium]|nr:GNAT family protein [Terriglobia bacterium]
MPEISFEPAVLEGEHVRLEPLTMAHLPRLVEIGLQDDIFRWYAQPIRTPEDMKALIVTALEEQKAGKSLPLATIARSTGLAVGSTRFMTIDRPNRSLEIGYTWIAPPWQRTIINTEAKYLMLGCAFDSWGCNRVGLKTDSLNERSRRAIARIGAKEEGTLRNHMVTASGRLRHSVYFSVTREEWPEVKAALEQKLATP